MSLSLTRWAWSVEGLSAPCRLVLLALADCCNGSRHSHTCWPSFAQLERMTALSQATIKRALRALEARSLIDRRPGSGRRSTVYRLACMDSPNASLALDDPTLDPLPASSRGVTVTPYTQSRGVTLTPLGVHSEPKGGHCDPRNQERTRKGTGETERDSDPEARAHAHATPNEPQSLSQGPPVPFLEIAAALRPDLPDPGAVKRKFEVHHTGHAFTPAEWDRQWRLWLLRERQTRADCSAHAEQVGDRAPGAFLANRCARPRDLSAEYEVIRDR